ncbi:MAG: amino acid ABC transporter permease [Candidatus Competibacterales bacterium]
MDYQFRFDVVWANRDFLLAGLYYTLAISGVALLMATLGGLVVALMSLSRLAAVRLVASSFGEVIRNTPILVQLLWWYYVIPILSGLRVEAFTAVVVGLSVYSSAFIAEVFRAGIQAVPKGHKEAAQVLGLSAPQTFIRVVLPQAVRTILPPLASNFVILIKYSSLASYLAVGEITRRGMELQASTFRPLEIFTVIAVVYFVICFPLTMATRYLEHRLARW